LASNRAPARPASPPGNAALVGSPLDRRLTFSTFQVGRSNQLAFSAAQRAVGRTTSFCPLYVHSAVGLGKTHLLQAVAHTAASQGRSVIYLTAEKFMYGFVASLQAQTSIAFKERLRTIDLLIFDDAQFLQGKAIQAEFGHALNALLDAGRDVIVAAARAPNDLEAVDERVRSRLGAGRCVLRFWRRGSRRRGRCSRTSSSRRPCLLSSPVRSAPTGAISKAPSTGCLRIRR